MTSSTEGSSAYWCEGDGLTLRKRKKVAGLPINPPRESPKHSEKLHREQAQRGGGQAGMRHLGRRSFHRDDATHCMLVLRHCL